MAYRLQGSLLEVCTCKVLCPCWIGEDPDPGTCDSTVAYHVDTGSVNNVDVSGLTLAVVCHIPGNVLKGNWRVMVFVDERATSQQEQALTQAFSGKLGGPLADFAQLFGEVVGVSGPPLPSRWSRGKVTSRSARALTPSSNRTWGRRAHPPHCMIPSSLPLLVPPPMWARRQGSR